MYICSMYVWMYVYMNVTLSVRMYVCVIDLKYVYMYVSVCLFVHFV